MASIPSHIHQSPLYSPSTHHLSSVLSNLSKLFRSKNKGSRDENNCDFGSAQTEYVQLGFPCNLNPMVLSAMYQEQTEVIGADPNYVVGGSGSSWTPEVLGGGVWSWTLEISFHDCTVGCACHKQYIFFTEPNDDPVLVWESSVVGPEYCPEVPEPLSPEALDFVKSFCNYQ